MSAWGYCQSVKTHVFTALTTCNTWCRILFFDIFLKIKVGNLISEYLSNLIFLALSCLHVFKSEANQKKMAKEIPGIFKFNFFSLVIIEITALIKWIAFKILIDLEGKCFC